MKSWASFSMATSTNFEVERAIYSKQVENQFSKHRSTHASLFNFSHIFSSTTFFHFSHNNVEDFTTCLGLVKLRTAKAWAKQSNLFVHHCIRHAEHGHRVAQRSNIGLWTVKHAFQTRRLTKHNIWSFRRSFLYKTDKLNFEGTVVKKKLGSGTFF